MKDDPAERHVRLIHNLAKRLPWITVLAVVLTFLAVLVQILLFGKA